MAFLSRFCLFVVLFVTSVLNFTAQLYRSNYFHRSHFHVVSSPIFIFLFLVYCFCTILVFECDLFWYCRSVGLLHGLLILRFWVLRVYPTAALLYVPKEDLFFFFVCICYQWHIVRNLSYRFHSNRVCVNVLLFFFCFKFSIKLMDSHGSSFLLRLFSEISCYYFLFIQKRAVVFAVLCVLSILFC